MPIECERPSDGMQSRSFAAGHVVTKFSVTQPVSLPSRVVAFEMVLEPLTSMRISREKVGRSVSAMSGCASPVYNRYR